jgi:hypothetical protein
MRLGQDSHKPSARGPAFQIEEKDKLLPIPVKGRCNNRVTLARMENGALQIIARSLRRKDQPKPSDRLLGAIQQNKLSSCRFCAPSIVLLVPISLDMHEIA